MILYHGTSVEPPFVKTQGLRVPTLDLLRDFVSEAFGIPDPFIPVGLDPGLWLTNSFEEARKYAFTGGWSLSNIFLNLSVGRRRQGWIYIFDVPDNWISPKLLRPMKAGLVTQFKFLRDIPASMLISQKRVR